MAAAVTAAAAAAVDSDAIKLIAVELLLSLDKFKPKLFVIVADDDVVVDVTGVDKFVL